MKKFDSIDDYINSFEPEIKEKLESLRTLLQKLLPDAIEVISYNMPAFKQNKVLVYFAGYKNHVGFYPTSSGITNFMDELHPYKFSKGAVQFPHQQPLPLELISKITLFRQEQDAQLAKTTFK